MSTSLVASSSVSKDREVATLGQAVFTSDNAAIYADPDAERERLRQAITLYQQDVKDGVKIDFQNLQSNSWSEVVKAVQTVTDERMKNRFIDLVGGNAPTMQAWLELLPADSEYFSIICGTLKLVFRVRLDAEHSRSR